MTAPQFERITSSSNATLKALRKLAQEADVRMTNPDDSLRLEYNASAQSRTLPLLAWPNISRGIPASSTIRRAIIFSSPSR